MQWELLLEVALVECVLILDSVTFGFENFVFFSHVVVHCFLVPFDFEVAFHDSSRSTPPTRVLPTPKPAPSRGRPVQVKIYKKCELLGEV